ncbi:hypothetical protein [Pseudorhodoferax sp. Leaf274]|uniref:hypothetical protein n=1 Tax=Pseudorhodoferax sp. Leaf274 TaxID=1736318 RepID=UPI0012E2B6B9|nr:hypothetical protein [Pseudorhodoferax sp. Leaf274]
MAGVPAAEPQEAAGTTADLHYAPAIIERPEPAEALLMQWEHHKLRNDVRKAVYALPEEFATSIELKDFRATDIFTLNGALGASIEDAVVRGLNKLRDVWDPVGAYSLYRFERQAQAFPDVRLVSDDPGLPSPLMGIELKGWFAIAKEGEPTFRYQVTPDACALQDLLVVFPWVLSDVVAGSPKLLPPFICEAKYAALLRNFYWHQMRTAEGGEPRILAARHRAPYPSSKVDQCSDKAAHDTGNNFGRVSRYGLMDEFIATTRKQLASGIPVQAWVKFFSHFSDAKEEHDVLIAGVARAFKAAELSKLQGLDALIETHEAFLAELKMQRQQELDRVVPEKPRMRPTASRRRRE